MSEFCIFLGFPSFLPGEDAESDTLMFLFSDVSVSFMGFHVVFVLLCVAFLVLYALRPFLHYNMKQVNEQIKSKPCFKPLNAF